MRELAERAYKPARARANGRAGRRFVCPASASPRAGRPPPFSQRAARLRERGCGTSGPAAVGLAGPRRTGAVGQRGKDFQFTRRRCASCGLSITMALKSGSSRHRAGERARAPPSRPGPSEPAKALILRAPSKLTARILRFYLEFASSKTKAPRGPCRVGVVLVSRLCASAAQDKISQGQGQGL